jgi:TonB-dependent starch-binding outer membrane protein SusC
MRNLIQLLLILLITNIAVGQRKQVTGTVTNSNGEPLSGVSVQTKNATTVTDAAGKFFIDVSNDEKVVFSHSGMKSTEVNITGNAPLGTIRMEDDPQNLDEIVVTGYTSEKKRDLKGAVTVVKMEDALKETNANLLTSLQSRVPGLVINTDGAPGSGATINLRGLASFNNNTPPLFIIDGVPTYDFNGLSPNDIESLQVLKDAASAAIYGARASSGVIVITTRKGKSKSAQVTFDAFYGVRTRRNKVDMLSAEEYGKALWQGYVNDGVVPSDPIYGNGIDPVVPAFIDASQTTPSANTDWQKEVFQPANNMAFNLGIGKSADKSNFYFGVNYNKEEGLAKYTFYDRLTARVNTAFKIGDRITIGENLSIGYLRGNRENEGRVLESAVIQLPIIPLKDNLGNWAGPHSSLGDFRNPLGDLFRFKDNISQGYRAFGNAYVDVEIIKGLTYHGSIALDLTKSGLKFFNARYVMGRFSSNDNSLTQNENSNTNLTATHTLTYNLAKGDHDLQVLAGYEWINNKNYSLTATSKSFFLENPDYIYLGAGTPLSNGGGGSEYGLIGQFGKVNYGWKDRYLISASVRRDGSSRFGKSERYGVFPAISAAWKIYEEEFITLPQGITDLKIRASWGRNGNDNIRDYNYATFYAPSIDYANYDVFGQNNVSNWAGATGFIVSGLGNPNTKWEGVEQTNIGIDVGLFNSRMYISADYYVKKSNDLLYQAQLPSTVGEGVRPFINVGNIKNSGIEMMISYKGANKGKLNYNVDFTFTSNKNKVLSVGVDGKDIQYPGQHIIRQGLSLGEFYGYINDGIFQNQKEVDDHAAQDGKAIGRLRFRDLNDDGIVNADDRTTLGSPLAKVIMGLNSNISYAGFDLSVFIDSRLGNKIWDQSKWNLDFLGYTSNHSRRVLDAWSPTNTNSKIPALTNANASFDKQNSSYYVSSGSFVRLKSIVLGYSVPKKFLRSLKMSNLRIFVQAQNILTLTPFDGYELETLNADLTTLGVSYINAYPHTKGVTTGLNLSF